MLIVGQHNTVINLEIPPARRRARWAGSASGDRKFRQAILGPRERLLRDRLRPPSRQN